jgi:putative transcriptional regulator
MSSRDGLSRFLAIAAVVCLGWTAQAPAAGIDEPVLLVAQRKLQSPIYSSTVLLVKPIANGAHIGFIVNKPTKMRLGELFPEHEPSRKVADPLFLGGPDDLNAVFALVERHGAAGDGALQITPDLFLAAEVKAVDHVIEAEADHARFFVGLVVWRPGELDEEMRHGLWFIEEPDAKLVLDKKTDGLWETLVRRLEARAKMI